MAGRVARALEVPGVVFTDLDERHNRLKAGIEVTVSREQVEAALRKGGTPRDAVIIEETEPIGFHSALRDNSCPALEVCRSKPTRVYSPIRFAPWTSTLSVPKFTVT